MFQPSFHLFKSMFQLGARAQARPYNKSLTLHRSVWRQVRLFLFYLSFIDIYICLHCILMLRSNVIGQACSREGRTTEDRGSNKRCKTCNNRCRWPANFFPTRPPRRLLGDSSVHCCWHSQFWPRLAVPPRLWPSGRWQGSGGTSLFGLLFF
jgi:hypothetical protein